MSYMRTYIKVDLEAVCENIRAVRACLPEDIDLLAVIKADGYGHGALPIGQMIEKRGLARYFGVATVEEGAELREGGITLPILLLGYSSPDQADEILQYDLIPTVYREEIAQIFSECAVKCGKTMTVHIALDTGMSRIGFPVNEQSADTVARIARLPGLRVEGMFSHFATADESDKTFSYEQMALFDRMTELLALRGITVPCLHLCNSAGILEFDHHRFSMVRAGIVMYGMYPSDTVDRTALRLRPAMEWKSHVVHIKTVEAGTPVSYGSTWRADRTTVVATVPVGYADGYPRSLSNCGCVLIHGRRAPVLGRVCMDQMMVDITEIPGVRMEDTVTLVGRDGDAEISMEEIGKLSGRFHYEFPCMISKRVPRVYYQKP